MARTKATKYATKYARMPKETADDLILYPVKMPSGRLCYFKLSQLYALRENVDNALYSAAIREATEDAYMEALHAQGFTKKAAKLLAIDYGIHYVIFDKWARIRKWRKN
jgi:hypothetical protein